MFLGSKYVYYFNEIKGVKLYKFLHKYTLAITYCENIEDICVFKVIPNFLVVNTYKR